MSMLQPQEKLELVTRHAEAELRCDWDGALATMIDNPFYVHYPLGIRVQGREAVKEHWKRLLATPGFAAAAESANLRHWVLGETLVSMYEWLVDIGNGQERPMRSYALFTFIDGLIESETIFSEATTDAVLSEALNDEFCSLPGVERLHEVV